MGVLFIHPLNFVFVIKEILMAKDNKVAELNIPEHVAIILDGNGRWARKRLLPRNMGHVEGAKTVEQICEDAWDIGIKYLTVYAFSTENWKRPDSEVKALMDLLGKYLIDSIERTNKNNMRVRVIGDETGLDDSLRASIDKLTEVSSVNDGLQFTIALNYGSRDEIVRAVRSIASDVRDGKLDIVSIDEDTLSGALDTFDIPDPDLLIRTSGEQRLSNFLLWQLGYSEFYFTDCLWPDFNKQELIKAIEYYNKRERRFGGV